MKTENNGIEITALILVRIVLMTECYPDPGQDIDGFDNEIKIGHKGKHFCIFATGVKVLTQLLGKISTPEFPPLPIDWQRFDDVFKWLSNSLDKVSQSTENEVVKFDSVQDFTRTGWGGGDFTQTPI
ncbi:MAG: hypothetical protein IPI77_16645 [Saprospiraceae bacterium]|nr:hypothetical protein [Saprospiraceae bacterium]